MYNVCITNEIGGFMKFSWLFLIIALSLVGCAKGGDTAEMHSKRSVPTVIQPNQGYKFDCSGVSCKTVLSIGDSISIGYVPYVARTLTKTHNVYHPEDNCRNSLYTTKHLDQWLAETPSPDVIIWNNGIWNTIINPLGPDASMYGTSLTDYRSQLVETATKLKATGARVVFFTSTVLDPGVGFYFDYGKIAQLNAVALEVLPGMGIEVHDLNALSLTIQDQLEDGIHYSPWGYQVLSDYVADVIRGDSQGAN
jgi:hypothetical protein